MAKESLYLKAERNIEITNDVVTLNDIAKMTCTNSHICNKAKTMKILHFHKNGTTREVISILKIIEEIQKEFPSVDVQNLGETDIVVELIKPGKEKLFFSVIKIIFVAMISFGGTAFTIMAFHNDISIGKLFNNIYELIMGRPTDGYTILEVSYSIGLAIGIIIFFNHIGGRRITKDPTPIEVEMRLYENDVNTTLIETWNREGNEIDVN